MVVEEEDSLMACLIQHSCHHCPLSVSYLVEIMTPEHEPGNEFGLDSLLVHWLRHGSSVSAIVF